MRKTRILTLESAPGGKLWVGESPGGLLEIDPARNQVATYSSAAGLFSYDVFGLMYTATGTLWVRTREGLFEGVQERGRFRFRRTKLPQDDLQQLTTGVTYDTQGRVWVANWSGLSVLEAGRWRRFTARDGLRLTGLAALAAGRRWFCLDRVPRTIGLARLDLREGRLSLAALFPRKWDAFGEGPVFNTDVAGHIWVAPTGRGVVRWPPLDHYDKTDGLIWNDCNAGAFLGRRGRQRLDWHIARISHFYAAAAPARPNRGTGGSHLGTVWRVRIVCAARGAIRSPIPSAPSAPLSRP